MDPWGRHAHRSELPWSASADLAKSEYSYSRRRQQQQAQRSYVPTLLLHDIDGGLQAFCRPGPGCNCRTAAYLKLCFHSSSTAASTSTATCPICLARPLDGAKWCKRLENGQQWRLDLAWWRVSHLTHLRCLPLCLIACLLARLPGQSNVQPPPPTITTLWPPGDSSYDSGLCALYAYA